MNFSEEILSKECNYANSFNDSLARCLFIRAKDECNDYEGLFNYASLFYCTLGASSKVLPLVVAGFFLLILFTSLGTTADDFLCPSLLVISKTLRLSQNIAGVTFLAFGNGAPDIFSSFAGIRQAKPELVVGTLFGAGIFVTCVVVAFILVTPSFKVMERPILRDIFFYGTSVFALWAFCYRGTIFLWEAIVFLTMYLIYILTVVIGRIIYNYQKDNEKKKIERQKGTKDGDTSNRIGAENPGIFIIPDSAGIHGHTNEGATNYANEDDTNDDEDNVFANAMMADAKNRFPHHYEGGDDTGDSKLGGAIRKQRYSSTSSRVTISSDVEEVTSFEYVPPNANLKSDADFGDAKKRSRKVSINEHPVSRLGIPCNSEPTPRGIIKNPRISIISNISGVSNCPDTNERPNRRRTLSHSRYLLHHHLDNTIFALTHHHNHDETCNDPRCLISSGLLSDDSLETNYGRHHERTPRVSTVSNLSGKSNVSIKSIQEEEMASLSEFSDLIIHIIPFDLTEWHEASFLSKFFIVWKSPIYFLLLISVPVVDSESYRANWCRLLNCFHLLSAPLTMLILTNNFNLWIGSFPLIGIVSIIGFILALTTYFITNFHEAPKFHSAFAYIGFCASVSWIYFLANEVIDLLQAIGILFGLSDVILGLTVLAWGNSLGDLISNISMAKQGFPRMGISACFGGPLLNLLLGIGLPYTLLLIETKGHFLNLVYSRMITLLFSTLMTGLIVSILFFFWNGFLTLKKHGAVLFLIYLIYLTLAILIETQVI